MPADHSKHGFLQNIGTDWVALAANGEPLARASDEESVRRAAPNADRYINGKALSTSAPEKPTTKTPEPVAAVEPVKEEPVKEEPVNPETDHDGGGKMGGSEKGANATASKSRRKRKPAA